MDWKHLWSIVCESLAVGSALVVSLFAAGWALWVATTHYKPSPKTKTRSLAMLVVFDRAVDVYAAGIGVAIVAFWSGGNQLLVFVGFVVFVLLLWRWGRAHGQSLREADGNYTAAQLQDEVVIMSLLQPLFRRVAHACLAFFVYVTILKAIG